MTTSRSTNNMPDEYMELTQNIRIYDGGFGPRLGKQILTDSSVGTNNKGGFTMNGKLFQIANSTIYEVDLDTGVQTSKASLGYDAYTDILVYGKTIAIIVSPGQTPKWYDGNVTVTNITTVPAGTTGIVEFCRNYSFITKDNILYISRPITAANPEYAYDWTGSGSQNITYETVIKGLLGTMNGLFVFLQDRIEFLGANSLQNVAGAAAFISIPLGRGAAPISNACISASGDKVFYISENLNIQTVNYVAGTESMAIGELSSRPMVGIRDLLQNVATIQPTAWSFYNDNDKIIEFHVRSIGAGFNDTVIFWDLINETFGTDTDKNYNYTVKIGYDYYGFSDVNSSIYLDGTGFSDNGVPIRTLIRAGGYHLGSILQKLFGGFYTSGSIGLLTDLDYNVYIDGESVFQETISGQDENQQLFEAIGDLSGEETSGEPIAGDLYLNSQRSPFDRTADEGRIYQYGKRITIEISSDSQIQDWLVDMLGILYEKSSFTDIPDKF